MVFINNKQSLKSAKHDFEIAYIQQVIQANDYRLRKVLKALSMLQLVKNSIYGLRLNYSSTMKNDTQLIRHNG